MMPIEPIDRLVADMHRPIFVLNMAKGSFPAANRSNSAVTRANNARKELHDLVMAYAKEYVRGMQT